MKDIKLQINSAELFWKPLLGIMSLRDGKDRLDISILALQGATILFSPMCNKVSLGHAYAQRPSYYSHFVARSHENRCWLISADWIWTNDGTSVCPDHSVIYDPDGREITRSQEGEEQFLIAEIPFNHLFHKKGRRVHGSQELAREIERLTQETMA